eukprot:PITA_17174
MIKIISWNSRGLGHPSKTNALKDIINQEKPSIILLQETNQRESEINKNIDCHKRYKGCICEARGTSGGITTIWSQEEWNSEAEIIEQHWIKTVLRNNMSKQQIVIFNIYTPNHYRDKKVCWDSLSKNIMEEDSSNIILGGDLNLILHANEKRGGSFTPYPFRNQLETIMQNGDLIDIIPKNRKYSWSNHRLGSNNIMERLDQFLVNISFLSTYSVVNATILPFAVSDHHPITLAMDTHYPLGPLPFKYNHIWSDYQATKSLIQQTWGQHVEGSPGFIWENKFKNVKKVLKNWAKTQYNEPKGKKREQATARQIKNNITVIIDNAGTQQTDQTAIKGVASDHFKELLTETGEEELFDDLLQHLPTKITVDLNKKLTEEIKEEEIKEAIWCLQPNKAPRPDGFPICFYREYWDLTKKDLIKYFKWIQRKGKIGGYTNSTHLALIPKENRPSNFSHSKPISLCNSSYKIFTKILASRLKPLLPMLISENQGGFMANKQISDSILLVQEAIHSSHSRNEKGFILKLDLANAFDRVRHSFLFAVLQKMGFSPFFLDIIRACISSPWIAPLINGRPGPSFQSSRGLRQGCPLSPYLFLLMAESFSCKLDRKR